MSPSWKGALAVLVLILTLVVAALLATAWTVLPLDSTAITIDGDTFSLADFTGADAVLFFVVAVAALVFALVVALAAGAVGLGLGALGLALGLAVTLGVLTLVASPFLLFVWLLWRGLRTRRMPVPAHS